MKRSHGLLFILVLSIVAGCRAPSATPGAVFRSTVAPLGVATGPPPSATPTAPPDVSRLTPDVAPAGGPVRPAAVAGSFYPGDAEMLAATVDALLADAERYPALGEAGSGLKPIALVVPHAGYVYSGPVAAAGFKQVEGEQYQVVIVVGTNHGRPDLDRVAVYPNGVFATPLGSVAVDAELAAELVATSDRIVADPSVFAEEHSLEVELPFLQRALPGVPMVPVMVGTADWENVVTLSDALAQALAGRDALIVASTDLSHYPSYDDAVSVDGALLEAIQTMEPEQIHAAIQRSMAAGINGLATCACGEGPLTAVMRAAASLGANRATVLDYANSGDTPLGDRTQVVGYGAVMFWKDAQEAATPVEWRAAPASAAVGAGPLPAVDQDALLALARRTLERFLVTQSFPPFQAASASLRQERGVFVTLKQEGELRGCIGSMVGSRPVYLEVQRSAVLAALDDPRFPPVTAQELPGIDLEISVLGPLELVTDTQTIQVGVHGLLIVQGSQHGTLLPQVPVEQGWDRDRFLVEVCRKAGLPDDAWRTAELYRYTAQVFGE